MTLINNSKKNSLLLSPFYKTVLETLTQEDRDKLETLEYEELIEVLKNLINKRCVQKIDYFD